MRPLIVLAVALPVAQTPVGPVGPVGAVTRWERDVAGDLGTKRCCP
jgi:hypothetical protein